MIIRFIFEISRGSGVQDVLTDLKERIEKLEGESEVSEGGGEDACVINPADEVKKLKPESGNIKSPEPTLRGYT